MLTTEQKNRIEEIRNSRAKNGDTINDIIEMIKDPEHFQLGDEYIDYLKVDAPILADAVKDLLAIFGELERENLKLKAALHRDQTGLAEALSQCMQSAEGRTWLLNGRGPYKHDDEEYRKEAGYALTEIIQICQSALAKSGSLATETLSGCSFEEMRTINELVKQSQSEVERSE